MKKLIIISFFHAAFLVQVMAQDGNYDLNFGINGISEYAKDTMHTRTTNMLVLPDESILISGNAYTTRSGSTFHHSFFIAKLKPQGEIDSTFGVNGTLFYPIGVRGKLFNDMILDNNGKVLVMSVINGTSVLMRMDLNGNLDNSFGANGVSAIDEGVRIGIQANGKIILASHHFDGANTMFKALRYNIDGSLDVTFGNNGSVIHDITNFQFDICNTMAIQSNDKILLAGYSYDDLRYPNAVVARLMPNGQLDSAYATSGVGIFPIGTTPNEIHAEFVDLEILWDNSVVLAGSHYYSGGTGGFSGVKPAMVKVDASGNLDSTFGNNGTSILHTINGANDFLRSIKVQPNSKIILAGSAANHFPSFQTDFYVARFEPDGTIDHTFANGGVLTTNFSGSETNHATVIDFLPSGKILVVGDSRDQSSTLFYSRVVRLNNENFIGWKENYHQEIQVVLYPNPASDFLTVSTKGQLSKLVVFDVDGQMVKSIVTENGTSLYSLYVGELASGVYFVKCQLKGDREQTVRFVKK